jgi:gamma-glutamyltranspeptidase/glutathione hydrolase
MADEDAATARRGGRAAGLAAARAAFYRGDLAQKIVAYHKANDGWLREDDLADFRVDIETPLTARFGDVTVFGCRPWCQGPVLLQTLKILDGIDLKSLGHNTADYIHTLIEAMKLAFADRHAYYADPKFVDVPIDALLSDAYAARRRTMINPDSAWPELPPAGTAAAWRRPLPRPNSRNPTRIHLMSASSTGTATASPPRRATGRSTARSFRARDWRHRRVACSPGPIHRIPRAWRPASARA